MEQQQENQKLNIILNLKTDGELNLSGNIGDLSDEEWLLVQEVLSQSRERSQATQALQRRLQEGQLTVGICGAVAVFMLTLIPMYAITSWISAQVNQVNQVNQQYVK